MDKPCIVVSNSGAIVPNNIFSRAMTSPGALEAET